MSSSLRNENNKTLRQYNERIHRPKNAKHDIKFELHEFGCRRFGTRGRSTVEA